MAFAPRQPGSTQKNSQKSYGGALVSGVLLVLMLVVFVKQQSLADWLRLRGYTPTAEVSALAATDTFTPIATHMFYINRPSVVAKEQFTQHCTANAEQTIILGCYHGIERGIYVLRIAPDSRLDGVMQVTAAHEMLHAAYDRLSDQKRQQVDSWLEDYYAHALTDDRVKATIAAYQKSEPDAVTNEMHSVFGTEVAQLPAPLEEYYKQYFTDRQAITRLAGSYQAEFTSREKQVAAYDRQLSALKKQIEGNESQLDVQSAQLKQQAAEMNRLKRNGQTSAYNARVDTYNVQVAGYDRLVTETKSLINQYNQLVSQRNALAVEQQQLTKELSGESVQSL